MAAPFIPLETVRGLDRGPLVRHIDAYIERARTEGYPPKTVLVHVQLIASLNQYLRRTRRGARDVNERLIALGGVADSVKRDDPAAAEQRD